MRTLNKKVLPVVRVLPAKCNEGDKYHKINFNGYSLSMFEEKRKENDSFKFYRVLDGLSMFDIAVSKNDNDVIIPVKMFHDIDQTWWTFCQCGSDGLVIFPEQTTVKEHEIFVLFTETFLQYANIYHKIV